MASLLHHHLQIVTKVYSLVLIFRHFGHEESHCFVNRLRTSDLNQLHLHDSHLIQIYHMFPSICLFGGVQQVFLSLLFLSFKHFEDKGVSLVNISVLLWLGTYLVKDLIV